MVFDFSARIPGGEFRPNEMLGYGTCDSLFSRRSEYVGDYSGSGFVKYDLHAEPFLVEVRLNAMLK